MMHDYCAYWTDKSSSTDSCCCRMWEEWDEEERGLENPKWEVEMRWSKDGISLSLMMMTMMCPMDKKYARHRKIPTLSAQPEKKIPWKIHFYLWRLGHGILSSHNIQKKLSFNVFYRWKENHQTWTWKVQALPECISNIPCHGFHSCKGGNMCVCLCIYECLPYVYKL